MTTPTPTPDVPRWRWNWAWTPFLVIGIALVPNIIMLTLARSARLDPVTGNAYADSARFDEQRSARAAFDERGLDLQATRVEAGIHLQLLGLAASDRPGTAHVLCYHSTDQRRDDLIPWPDPHQPLLVPRPGPGSVWLELVLELDGQELRQRIAAP